MMFLIPSMSTVPGGVKSEDTCVCVCVCVCVRACVCVCCRSASIFKMNAHSNTNNVLQEIPCFLGKIGIRPGGSHIVSALVVSCSQILE